MLQLTRSEQAWLKEFLESLSAETLTKARERARAAGADQIQLESRTGDVAQSVIAIAKEKAADVIVVGKRGAGLVERLLLGSVSEKGRQARPFAGDRRSVKSFLCPASDTTLCPLISCSAGSSVRPYVRLRWVWLVLHYASEGCSGEPSRSSP
jgi:hypothetical protein